MFDDNNDAFSAKELPVTLVREGRDKIHVTLNTGTFLDSTNLGTGIPEGTIQLTGKLLKSLTGTEQEAVSSPIGGIDLNPALMDLQIKRDGNGVPLPFNLQPAEIMNIEGLLPVIINVTPVLNVPLLLGLDMPVDKKPYNSADSDPTSSMELGFSDKYRNRYIREYHI